MNCLDPETIASLKALDDGDGFFAEIVSTFLGNARPTLSQLASAQAANDLPALERLAHKLRGAASTVGAQRLMALCSRLETAARQGTVVDAAADVETIETEFQRVVAALEVELQA
ncbi:MAG: Hpt domain-containing protein [Chloracidobacterium sp.]|uniref:Hpt domain-containing protein n=1 Tax=Chloracidobacterium validum TaxID=2821543 RepID=A0ABX8BFA9_9BACT|nr:Hpt domain-containing protein [Chloracidobacterium validum]QUW04600.1 Hpt domain-containing protein [Chloracidobacterium validum]